MPAWLMTVWGRRLLMGVGVLVLLLGARWYFVHQGEMKGRAAAAQEATTQIELERAQAREEVSKALNQSAADIEAAQRRYDTAKALLVRQQETITQLVGQRQQQTAAIAQIPDAGLHAFNTHTLGLRKPEDVTSGYLPSEEREIAKCLSDRPLCEQENKATADALHTTQTQIASLQDKIAALETRDTAVLSYANSVEKLYVQLYNQMPRKRNWLLSIVTFGVRGKPKVLNMPDPLTLQRRRQILFPESQ